MTHEITTTGIRQSDGYEHSYEMVIPIRENTFKDGNYLAAVIRNYYDQWLDFNKSVTSNVHFDDKNVYLYFSVSDLQTILNNVPVMEKGKLVFSIKQNTKIDKVLLDLYQKVWNILDDINHYTSTNEDTLSAIFYGPFVHKLFDNKNYHTFGDFVVYITIYDSETNYKELEVSVSATTSSTITTQSSTNETKVMKLIKNYFLKFKANNENIDSYLISNADIAMHISDPRFSIVITRLFINKNFNINEYNKNAINADIDKILSNTFSFGSYNMYLNNGESQDCTINSYMPDLMSYYDSKKGIYLQTDRIVTFDSVCKKRVEVSKRDLNIKYLWDYTRHSKTLNINLVKMAENNNNKENMELYNYPIIKESSQESTSNIIYQSPEFMNKYAYTRVADNYEVKYLFQGKNILDIKKMMIMEMKSIINKVYGNEVYDNYFFCYRISSYLDKNNLARKMNPLEIKAAGNQTIPVPYFFSVMKDLSYGIPSWLLDPNMTLLLIRSNEKYKNFVSIDPCYEHTECYFGSENEILFMPDFELKITSVEKILLNIPLQNLKYELVSKVLYVNVALCDMINIDEHMKIQQEIQQQQGIIQQGIPQESVTSAAYPYDNRGNRRNFPKRVINKNVNEEKIALMSYNISYQAIKGIAEGTVTTQCPIVEINKERITACAISIANVIDIFAPYDFLCLVEASDAAVLWKFFKNEKLLKMKIAKHKSGENEIWLCYDGEKYDDVVLVNGEFEADRPYIMAFSLTHNLCVIAVHAGHYNSIFSLGPNITHMLEANTSKDNIMKILEDGNIIIMGDFNYNFTPNETVFILDMNSFKRKLFGINKDPSCCLPNLGSIVQTIHGDLYLNFDQIISTISTIKSRVINSVVYTNDISQYDFPRYSSDHLPIFAEISLTSPTALTNIPPTEIKRGGNYFHVFRRGRSFMY